LHVFGIGAARYREALPQRFENWTVLDSMPFMKAVNRRGAQRSGGRVRWERALGENVADLLLHNAGRYSEWIARKHV
jgi:hypothetical protein